MYLWTLCLFFSPSTGLGEIRIWFQFLDPTSPKILRNNIAQKWLVFFNPPTLCVCVWGCLSLQKGQACVYDQSKLLLPSVFFLTANVTVDTCLCMLMSHHKLLMSRLQQPLKNFEVLKKKFLFHASKWYVICQSIFRTEYFLPSARSMRSIHSIFTHICPAALINLCFRD